VESTLSFCCKLFLTNILDTEYVAILMKPHRVKNQMGNSSLPKKMIISCIYAFLESSIKILNDIQINRFK
jgi:hypothetical protein